MHPLNADASNLSVVFLERLPTNNVELSSLLCLWAAEAGTRIYKVSKKHLVYSTIVTIYSSKYKDIE